MSTVKSMDLLTSSATNLTTHFRIDRALSRLNHRHYKEPMIYKGKFDLDANSTQTVDVYVLRWDWMVKNAYKHGYQAFLDNTQAEREAVGGRMARWYDFRIGYPLPAPCPEQLPVSYNGATLGSVIYSAGEFELSKVSLDNGTDYSFQLHASSGANFGMMEEYAKKANTGASPEEVETNIPYQILDTDNTDNSIFQHLQDAGNEPPYNPDSIGVGTAWVRVARLSAGAAQKLTTGMIDIPFGIVLLDGYNPRAEDPAFSSNLMFTAKSGSYKGVDAEPVCTVKKAPKNRLVVQ